MGQTYVFSQELNAFTEEGTHTVIAVSSAHRLHDALFLLE